MKVAVFGFGSLNYYLNKLNVPERLGGDPPYGGSAMALEFAKTGKYEVWLADPHFDKVPPEVLKKLEDAGVRMTTDDTEAATDAQVAVMFTPFRAGITFKITENIIPHLGEGAVIGTTCTMSCLVLKAQMERPLLKAGRRDIGFSTMHPAAIPGTPQHQHYLIATNELLREPIATEEQIQRLKLLAEDSGKKAYLIPAELVSPIGDMGIVVTSIALVAAIEYYIVSRKVLHTRKPQTEFQIAQSLTAIANVVSKYGLEGLVKLFNLDAVKDSLKSMLLDEDLQPMTLQASYLLQKLPQLCPEIFERAEKAEIKDKIYLSIPSVAMEDHVIDLLGDRLLKNLVRDAWIQFYEMVTKRKDK
jgi:H2-forming N(5),N(10)-methenyltetrahydromethanopterin dehydrogenase-like protein